jgi:hypothetical protein
MNPFCDNDNKVGFYTGDFAGSPVSSILKNHKYLSGTHPLLDAYNLN